MKKLIAFILCLVMTVTALPVFALADNEAPMVITAIEAFSADNMPVSIQQAEQAAVNYENFGISGPFKVRLSDSSVQDIEKNLPFYILHYDRQFAEVAEEFYSELKEECGENTAYFGYDYVKCDDVFKAKNEGSDTIIVYAEVYVCEYNPQTERHDSIEKFELSYEKECVSYYVKLTPVSGLPDYFDRTTGVVDLSNTVFDIESYDGSKKQAKAVQTGIENMLPAYELDGRKLEYRIGIDSRTVFLTYYDWQYSWEVSSVKEAPHEEIIIEDCIFEGNTLTEIVYSVKNCYGQTKSYRKSVTNPGGEILDIVDGYEIYVTQAERSRFCSKVYLRAGQTKTESIWPHNFDNFFMNFIAKIAVFIEKLKDR